MKLLHRVVPGGDIHQNGLPCRKAVKHFIGADAEAQQRSPIIAAVDEVEIGFCDDIGNVLFLHFSLEYHIRDAFLLHPPLQRRPLVAVSPDQKVDRGVRHLLGRVQQRTQLVHTPDGSDIDHLKQSGILQIGIFYLEAGPVLPELLQVHAVVDAVDLGPGDRPLPASLRDIVIAALHGKDQGVRSLVDPLLPPVQEPNQGMIPGKPGGVGHDGFRPEIPHLTHAGHAKVFRHLEPGHQRQWMD